MNDHWQASENEKCLENNNSEEKVLPKGEEEECKQLQKSPPKEQRRGVQVRARCRIDEEIRVTAVQNIKIREQAKE